MSVMDENKADLNVTVGASVKGKRSFSTIQCKSGVKDTIGMEHGTDEVVGIARCAFSLYTYHTKKNTRCLQSQPERQLPDQHATAFEQMLNAEGFHISTSTYYGHRAPHGGPPHPISQHP